MELQLNLIRSKSVHCIILFELIDHQSIIMVNVSAYPWLMDHESFIWFTLYIWRNFGRHRIYQTRSSFFHFSKSFMIIFEWWSWSFLINEEIEYRSMLPLLQLNQFHLRHVRSQERLKKLFFDWKDKKFKITNLFLKIWKFQLKYANVLGALVWCYSAEINSNI